MERPQLVKKGVGHNLIYQGYRHSKDKCGRDGKQYWRCTDRTCKGRVHTTTDKDAELSVTHFIDHDHEPHLESTAVAKMKNDLCQKAAENPTRPLRQLYRD